MARAKPGDVLMYHGKPWAVLIALDDTYEYIWRTYVPSIIAYQIAWTRILIDPCPREQYSIQPTQEVVQLILNRRK